MEEATDFQFRSNASDNLRKATPRQRKYTSKACNECRRRRAKCNGASPRCSRCINRGINCQYRAEEDKRRPAPRSYVEMLRGRIDLLERVLQIHSIDIDSSIAVLKGKELSPEPSRESEGSPSSRSNETQQLLHNDANSPHTAVEGPTESFGGMLSSDRALNFERDGEVRYFGPTSGRLNFESPDSNMRYDKKFPDTPQYPAVDISHVRAKVNQRFAVDDDDSIPEKLKLHLIDLFFEWYQPWCQTVNERLFRESRASHGRYHSPLLEFCILAVGARFSDLPDLRSDPADANTAGLLLFDKAEVLLYYDLKWPTITTIQSLSLLSILHVAVGADAAGWLRQGMAIRLALDMGLNFDAAALRGSNLLTTEEIELRRQIYWGLYCDDKLYAIYTGRVCTMLSCQASVQLPSYYPSTSTSLMDNHDIRTLIQLALIRLTKILEKVLMSLYPPTPFIDQIERVTFFDSCMLDLKIWYYDLPQDLKLQIGSTTAPAHSSAVYILHMLYHTTHILLGKAFLTGSRGPGENVIPDKKKAETPGHSEGIITKAGSCVYLAARQICTIARVYREVFGSFRRCPTTATHCTLSATLALLPSSTAAESTRKSRLAATIQSDIELCLEVLSELSLSWSTAGKLRAGLQQLVDSHGMSRKSFQKDEHQDIDSLIKDLETNMTYDLQPSESDGEQYDFDAMVVDNWGIGQNDLWLFSQDLEVFGSLPSDYQALDSLNCFANN